MIFLFSKNKVVLDCFTSRPEVHKFAPIDNAINYLPTWWKNISKSQISFDNMDMDKGKNMKHCIGFLDYFRNSFVMPMWSDLHLMFGKEGSIDFRWQYADETSSLAVHTANQRGAYLDERKYQHFKIEPPWIFKTNKLIPFSLSSAVWNLEEPEKIILFPGILNFYNQTALNINIACRRGVEPQEILIPLRQPLAHLIPMTEKKVILKTHLVSDAEISRIQKSTFFPLSFINSYSKLKKIKNVT
jgi:hypothetical protein